MVSVVEPTVNDVPVAVAVYWLQPVPAGPQVTTFAVPVDAVAQFTRTEVAVASVRYGFLVSAAAAPAVGAARTPSKNTADATQHANRRDAIPASRAARTVPAPKLRDRGNLARKPTAPPPWVVGRLPSGHRGRSAGVAKRDGDDLGAGHRSTVRVVLRERLVAEQGAKATVVGLAGPGVGGSELHPRYEERVGRAGTSGIAANGRVRRKRRAKATNDGFATGPDVV